MLLCSVTAVKLNKLNGKSANWITATWIFFKMSCVCVASINPSKALKRSGILWPGQASASDRASFYLFVWQMRNQRLHTTDLCKLRKLKRYQLYVSTCVHIWPLLPKKWYFCNLKSKKCHAARGKSSRLVWRVCTLFSEWVSKRCRGQKTSFAFPFSLLNMNLCLLICHTLSLKVLLLFGA